MATTTDSGDLGDGWRWAVTSSGEVQVSRSDDFRYSMVIDRRGRESVFRRHLSDKQMARLRGLWHAAQPSPSVR